MTELVDQWICIKFCVKLKHSSMETIQMIQKARAMGTWWLAASSRQRACSWFMSCAECFGERANHPGDSWLSPPQSRFGIPCDFWLFPKLKWPLNRTRFQTIDEIQENTIRQLMAIGRTVWGSKVPTVKGTEASLSYVQCFLYNVSSSINVSIVHVTCLDTFWTDLICQCGLMIILFNGL